MPLFPSSDRFYYGIFFRGLSMLRYGLLSSEGDIFNLIII
jgi:hypothetical protein